MLNHATVCFFVYTLTHVDTGQSEFVLTLLRVIVTRFSAVILSMKFWAKYRGLMYFESSTTLDCIPLYLPLHCDAYFNENMFRLIVKYNLDFTSSV